MTHAKPRLGAQAATWLRGATAGKEPQDRRLRLQPAAAGTAPPSPWLTWKEAGRRGRMQPQILYGGPERPNLLRSAAARWKGVLSSSFLRSRFCHGKSKYFRFFSVSPLWSLNSSQKLKLLQKRNRSPADSLLTLTYNKLGI